MEETKPTSKVRRLADKLAVEQEPGLNTSQLMLMNYDLKPVEVSSFHRG
jgi:NCS1 family nucleobase:cation symporter-1